VSGDGRRRGSLGSQERLDRLEKAIDRLREVAEAGTVVVEGTRDVAALEWLGIGGLHVKVNQGRPLPSLLEDLAQSPPPVVLLVDWDRKGGQLVSLLEGNLRARVQVDLACRRRIAQATRTRCLEEVPAELEALRRTG
jgi:5S rRNA maturation endonuclease (ribonuclease M5)